MKILLENNNNQDYNNKIITYIPLKFNSKIIMKEMYFNNLNKYLLIKVSTVIIKVKILILVQVPMDPLVDKLIIMIIIDFFAYNIIKNINKFLF